MEVLDGKIQEGTARSNANYLSFFEDKSEELYRLYYMYKCLNDLRSNIRKLETPQQIQEYIGENSHRDSFRNAVEKRHCCDTDKCRDSLGCICKINICHCTQHVKSYNHKRRRCGEGWNCQKDR